MRPTTRTDPRPVNEAGALAEGLVALYTGAKVEEPGNEPSNEVVMVSIWEDEESVVAFVGPKWHAPVVLHGETELVLQREVANHRSR
jgi:heme-degrading monooxygenase HmoA